ncbi:MAG: acyltransferase family protein [Acutalibacteraceae bacterium]
MIIFLLFIFMLAFADLKAARPDEFFDDYIARENTTAINGLFVLLIFLSHAEGYIKANGILDDAYLTFKNNILQLVVVSFLFYSGFGIMESIKHKGQAYVRSIPMKRFFKVYYRLFISVCLFLGCNLIIRKSYGLKTTLLAFTGWTGIGNSNWYIFAILVLYIFVFVSFIICKKRLWLGVALTTLLSAAYVVIQIKLGRDGWNYNTVMLFPTGMIFSMIKEPFEKVVKRNDSFWFLSVGIVAGAFAFLHFLEPKNIATYSLWAIAFMLTLVLITMKIQIKNPILSWFGSHVFSVYMLQRIPMNLLSHYGFAESHKYAFIAVSFAATVILSYFFEQLTGKTDKLIFKKSAAKTDTAA